MKVQLKLHGPLQKYGKSAGYFELEIAAKTCMISELISETGVPVSAISFVSVNGTKQGMNFMLKGGEKITVYSHVVGG
jgi:hypothetical protein